MKRFQQLAILLTILLAGASRFVNAAAMEIEQQITLDDLDSQRRFAVTAANIESYLHAGDRIVVYDTEGRSFALIYLAVVNTAPPVIEDSISGVYASRITGKPPYGTFDSRSPRVVLEQHGQLITGTYGEAGGKIEGYISGNVVKFEWSTPKSMIQSGAWKFDSDSDEATGEWHVSNSTTRGGRWKLSRLSSPKQPTVHEVLSLRGIFPSDQQLIQLEIANIGVVKISRDPAVIDAYVSGNSIATKCASPAALDTIAKAELEFKRLNSTNSRVREDIERAKKLAASPRCDSEQATAIASQAITSLEKYAGEFTKTPRPGKSAGQLADECTDAGETVAMGIMTAGVYFLVAPFYTVTCMAMEAAADGLKR